MPDNKYTDSGGGFGAYIPGLMLILFGLLILYAPKLLAIMVAAFFVSLGIIVIWIGHRMRRSQKSNREIVVNWFGNDI